MRSADLKQLEQDLIDAMAEEISRYGFSKNASQQSFIRAVGIGQWILHLSFVEHEGDFDVTADVAIRVEAVETMINKSNRLLTSTEKKRTATCGAEVGNIVDGRQRRWTVSNPGDINPTAAAIAKEFRVFGIPYLERFSDLKTMLQQLTQHDKSAWLHSPIHPMRCKTIVALAMVLEEHDQASVLATTCAEFLKSRNDPGLQSFRQFLKEVGSP